MPQAREPQSVLDAEPLTNFTDDYYRELQESLAYAEPPLDEGYMASLVESADALAGEMRSFEEAERTCGPDMETWDNYAERHKGIQEKIERAGDIAEQGASKEEQGQAVADAKEAMDDSAEYLKERCALLLQSQQDYEAQIAALKAQIADLSKQQGMGIGSPEDFARCMAVSMDFLKQVDKMRSEASSMPRPLASEMFKETRARVKEAYYGAKLAPTKIKEAIAKKAHQAMDRALHGIAGIMDSGIAKLEQKRSAVLAKSHEYMSVIEVYRSLVKEEASQEKGGHTLEADARVADRMAKLGYGSYVIEKTLLKESPHRKEMEEGKAKDIAKKATDAAKEAANEREETKGASR